MTKKCPFCAEEIQAEAVKCKHCGSLLVQVQPSAPQQVKGEPRVTLKQAVVVVLAGAVFVAWAGFRDGFSCYSKAETDAQARQKRAENDQTIEAEGVEMGKALRRYYPAVRSADERFDEANECVEKHKGDRKGVRDCVKTYEMKLGAIETGLAPSDGLSGCALAVALATRGVIQEAIREQKARAEEPWGVGFGPLHDRYRDCAARLFRVGLAWDSATPAKPDEVEAHLGLRDDAPPGPATFAKERMGHLWLASGRELDRATLAVK